jgi:hypothetical protein
MGSLFSKKIEIKEPLVPGFSENFQNLRASGSGSGSSIIFQKQNNQF